MEQETTKNKTGYFKKLVKDIIRDRWLHFMVLLGIIWMIIFNYIPMYGIIIAFKDYSIIDTFNSAPWVGLQHFKDLFSDENFIPVMRNTLGMSLLKLIIGFPIPIIFAILINEIVRERFKKFAQTVSYLPHFFSWVVFGGMMINWLGETGLFNDIMMKIGIIQTREVWLADSSKFWMIAIISDIWKEVGWNSIIYLAAMAGIDPGLYEAAKIDGAGKLAQIWHITLPGIKSIILVFLVLAVAGILNTNFEQMLVLQNPLNLEASEVLDTYVYKVGIRSGRFSYATAVGLFKSVIATILLLSAHYMSKKINDKGVL